MSPIYSRVGFNKGFSRRPNIGASISPADNIVQSGLIVNLDAGNSSSYPGSGTTWTDLSGNGNNGTLVNGVGYSASNQGILNFDGVDDYVSLPTAVLSGLSELTVGMFIYPNLVNNYGSLFAEGGIEGYPSFPETWWQFNLLTQIWYTRDASTGSTGTRDNDLGVDFLTVNSWNYVTAVYSVTNSYKRYYINGVQQATTSTSIDALTTDRFPYNSFIGRPTDANDPTDNYFSGNIATVHVYNKALSLSEISQNFEYLRGRFSI